MATQNPLHVLVNVVDGPLNGDLVPELHGGVRPL